MSESAFLAEFIAARRRHVDEVRAGNPLETVREAAEKRTERRDFAAALQGQGLGVIAELKQASPSRGVIRREYRPREIARGYEAAGAVALSVLTEEQFFRGSLADMEQVREAVRLPVLRKDFIIDEYQVYESVAAGADALLLIVAALDDRELRPLVELSRELGITALVEVHTEEEVRRAASAGSRIIGVNNRSLKTLEVDLQTSFRLRETIPAGCLTVSESGIRTPEDLARIAAAGFDAVLIGEHLLLQDDPGRELARLIAGAPKQLI